MRALYNLRYLRSLTLIPNKSYTLSTTFHGYPKAVNTFNHLVKQLTIKKSQKYLQTKNIYIPAIKQLTTKNHTKSYYKQELLRATKSFAKIKWSPKILTNKTVTQNKKVNQ